MDYKNRDWLFQKFAIEGLSDKQIGELCNVSKETIRCYRDVKFNINKKDRTRKCKKCGDVKNMKPSGRLCYKCHNELKNKWFENKTSQQKKQLRRKYCQSDVEKIKNSSLDYQIYRWAKRTAQHKKLSSDLLEILAKEAIIKFPYLTFSPGNKSYRSNQASVDRIDSNKGYIPSNVRIIPYWLNSAKQNMSENELREKMEHYLSI